MYRMTVTIQVHGQKYWWVTGSKKLIIIDISFLGVLLFAI